jgi:hypothetical protein
MKLIRMNPRRVAVCETLEDRQLLNRGWGFPGGPGMWDATTGKPQLAQVQAWHGMKGHGPHRPVSGAEHHGPGSGPLGMPGADPLASNPQAKAAFQTLQSDVKALQSEVPATLQSQLKTDKATIDQALSSLTPAQRHSAHDALSTNPGTPPSDPTAFLTTQLQAANVPTAQINQIVTDLQTYQTTLKTIDPTLSAKIAADQQALAADLPAGSHGGHFSPAGGLLGPGLL